MTAQRIRYRSALPWVLGLLVLAGCASVPYSAPLSGPAYVLVARRGWHVDVGFATQDLEPPVTFVRAQFPTARYVFFGFGDERYVRSPTHRLPALLLAAWPGDGVMLVTALDNTPNEAFGEQNVTRLPLTRGQSRALADYIGASFRRTTDDSPIKTGPYADSLYYASSKRYSAIYTCNTWVAQALQRAGLPVRSAGVLTAGQLSHQVRRLSAGEP